MTPAEWDRLKTVFQGALDQPAHERHAWLAQACADDQTVLSEAEALLLTHETAGDFLEHPAQIDPEDVEALTPGSRLGDYEIIAEIGRGGMGVVYLAEDVRLGRRVALKSLPMLAGAGSELRDRLRREARTAATISHPSVATVYALEEVGDQLIIVSEYVAGGTLRSEIDRGPLDPVRAGAIAIDVARALCAAHDAGVIHRDLKPENILITADGTAKVVDFGIALVGGTSAIRLTRTGALLGTPAYMAPEQTVGSSIDARADLYSFGVVIHEMLTGRHPLSPAKRTDVDERSEPPAGEGGRAPAPPPASHRAPYARLMTIATRCMRAHPADRFASARELLQELGSDPLRAAGDEPAGSGGPGSARWWWEFHQAITALLYWLMVIPAWWARELIDGSWGRAFFVVTLASVVVAANLRLHLWFTSRFYPAELRWVRRRTRRPVAVADWLFSSTLVSAGLLIGEQSPPLAVLLISFGLGAAVSFLLIEPVTTRAAFKTSPTASQ